MINIVIQHVPAAESPDDRRQRLGRAADASVAVRIEADDSPVGIRRDRGTWTMCECSSGQSARRIWTKMRVFKQMTHAVQQQQAR